MASQAENIKILETDYYIPINFTAADTKLVVDETQPCNKEIIYKLEPAPQTFISEINALQLTSAMRINNRFEAVGGGTPDSVQYPCTACVRGNAVSNRVIDLWKKGEDTPAYKDCLRKDGTPDKYWDICCIISQIYLHDYKRNANGMTGHCGQYANSLESFRYWKKKFENKTYPANPCNPGGYVQFTATTRPKLDILVTVQGSVPTKNGIVTKEYTAKLVKLFGKDRKQFRGSLQPVIDSKPLHQYGNLGGDGPNDKYPPINWSGYPQACDELFKQGLIPNDPKRPCTRTLGGPGGYCEKCPNFKSTLSCGYLFYECRDYGKQNTDVRCKRVGFSTNPNSRVQLRTFGDVINRCVNGDDVSYSDTDVSSRTTGLPAKPLEGIMREMFNYALEVAAEITGFGLINAIEKTRAEAVAKITAELNNISDKCGPVAIKTTQYNVGIATWPPPNS